MIAAEQSARAQSSDLLYNRHGMASASAATAFQSLVCVTHMVYRDRCVSGLQNTRFKGSRFARRVRHSPEQQQSSANGTDTSYNESSAYSVAVESGGDDGKGVGSIGQGGNGFGYGRGRDYDGYSDGEIPEPIAAVLRKSGRAVDSLAYDVREAVLTGGITAEELARVLALEDIPLLGALLRAWPALRNRLVANPRFAIQLGVELLVGFVTKTVAEIEARASRFWNEFNFYLSDLALELVGDAMLVWLLCPCATFALASRNGWFASKIAMRWRLITAVSLLQRATKKEY